MNHDLSGYEMNIVQMIEKINVAFLEHTGKRVKSIVMPFISNLDNVHGITIKYTQADTITINLEDKS